MAGELKKRSGERWRECGSIQETVVVDLLRTDDRFQYHFGRLFREFGLTQPQYNVLRILRAEAKPLPCLEIAGRLIAMVPAITSLIDKLESKHLVSRKQCHEDRRVWYISLTGEGSKLLSQMDDPVSLLHAALCEGLTDGECKQLVQLLEKARTSPTIADTEP